MKTPFTYRHFLFRFGSVFLHDFQNFSLSRCDACHDAGMSNTFSLCDGAHILSLDMMKPQSAKLNLSTFWHPHITDINSENAITTDKYLFILAPFINP